MALFQLAMALFLLAIPPALSLRAMLARRFRSSPAA